MQFVVRPALRIQCSCLYTHTIFSIQHILGYEISSFVSLNFRLEWFYQCCWLVVSATHSNVLYTHNISVLASPFVSTILLIRLTFAALRTFHFCHSTRCYNNNVAVWYRHYNGLTYDIYSMRIRHYPLQKPSFNTWLHSAHIQSSGTIFVENSQSFDVLSVHFPTILDILEVIHICERIQFDKIPTKFQLAPMTL